VRLGVADRLLVPPAVVELVPQVPQGPVFVGALLQQPDPGIGDAHGKAVVEPCPSLRGGDGQPGHTAHILGNREGIGADVMDDAIRQRQIGQGVFIDASVEVVGIGQEGFPQAVVQVEHARHAVEAKAVEAVLVEPEPAVGQQKVQDRGFAVVETARIPRFVPAPGPAVEVLVARAVEPAEPLHLVGGGVRVDEVHDHAETFGMGGVNELLEILRCAESRRGGEIAAYLIPEGAVVGMFLDGHELEDVVARAHDPREDRFRELPPGAHAFLLLRHAGVGLVDERGLRSAAETLLRPAIGSFRLPDLGVED